MRKKSQITLSFGICLFLITSCCNEEDVYHRLPSHVGRYYEDNDTIVFYSEETDEYETYIVCGRSESMYGSEVKGGYCSWVNYYYGMNYTLSRDSCDSPLHFSIHYDRIHVGVSSLFWSYYSQGNYDGTGSINDDDFSEEVNLLGYTYNEIANGEFYYGDSLKSYLFSKEYGIIQYSFEHKTFSLLRN